MEKGDWVFKAGGPPDRVDPGPKQMQKDKAHGSAPTEQRSGWGLDRKKDVSKGNEPPDKPDKGWARWKEELEAELRQPIRP